MHDWQTAGLKQPWLSFVSDILCVTLIFYLFCSLSQIHHCCDLVERVYGSVVYIS